MIERVAWPRLQANSKYNFISLIDPVVNWPYNRWEREPWLCSKTCTTYDQWHYTDYRVFCSHFSHKLKNNRWLNHFMFRLFVIHSRGCFVSPVKNFVVLIAVAIKRPSVTVTRSYSMQSPNICKFWIIFSCMLTKLNCKILSHFRQRTTDNQHQDVIKSIDRKLWYSHLNELSSSDVHSTK